MRVLLSDCTFAYLHPGGKQVLAAKLLDYLNAAGIDTRYENWHDPTLRGDVVHVLGYNDVHHVLALKRAGYRLVYTQILDWITNAPRSAFLAKRLAVGAISMLPRRVQRKFAWTALPLFDAIVHMHEQDRDTALRLFRLDARKLHVIPLAVDPADLDRGGQPPDAAILGSLPPRYLVSVGSIVPRKNAIFTARACLRADVPVVFIGHPFDRDGGYHAEFLRLCDGRRVVYVPDLPAAEKQAVLDHAQGFILLSRGESGCIAVSEAGARGLPLLLSDLPWAKGYEDPRAIRFCPVHDESAAAAVIGRFHATATRCDGPSFRVRSWPEVAALYRDVYETVLRT